MTVEEFTAKCDALAASHEELAQSYAESTASIDAEEVGTLALIQKLNDLASSSEQTAATQMQMQSIVDDLSPQRLRSAPQAAPALSGEKRRYHNFLDTAPG